MREDIVIKIRKQLWKMKKKMKNRQSWMKFWKIRTFEMTAIERTLNVFWFGIGFVAIFHIWKKIAQLCILCWWDASCKLEAIS